MKKTICCFCIFIAFLSPVHAKQRDTILIVAKDLPNLYLLEYQGSKHYQVRIIDRRTTLPMTCLNDEKASLHEIKLNEAALQCQIDSLNQKFHLSIKNYIRLDLKNIAKDFNLRLKDYNLYDFKSSLAIFQHIGNHLSISTIMNYKKYIKTDLSLNELYKLYKQYQNGPIKVHYYYPQLFWVPNKKSYYPLHSQFYQKK